MLLLRSDHRRDTALPQPWRGRQLKSFFILRKAAFSLRRLLYALTHSVGCSNCRRDTGTAFRLRSRMDFIAKTVPFACGAAQTEYPLLVAIDQFNFFFDRSGYRDLPDKSHGLGQGAPPSPPKK